jgi:ubiquitin-activating enzyme E1 C
LLVLIWQYTGDDSIYTYTFELEKKDDCPVCGGETATIEVDGSISLEEFIEQLKGDRLCVESLGYLHSS